MQKISRPSTVLYCDWSRLILRRRSLAKILIRSADISTGRIWIFQPRGKIRTTTLLCSDKQPPSEGFIKFWSQKFFVKECPNSVSLWYDLYVTLVGWIVLLSEVILLKRGEKLHFHAPIGALVLLSDEKNWAARCWWWMSTIPQNFCWMREERRVWRNESDESPLPSHKTPTFPPSPSHQTPTFPSPRVPPHLSPPKVPTRIFSSPPSSTFLLNQEGRGEGEGRLK